MRTKLKKISLTPMNWATEKNLAVILDTNILSYMLIPEARKQIDKYLSEYQTAAKLSKFTLEYTISAVTIYECLQGNNQSEYLALFKSFKCYELDMQTQYLSAQLKNFYKKRGMSKNDLPDIYISATSLLNAAGILTANQADYPELLFKESMARHIRWTEKERTKSIMLYLLRPDYNRAKDKGFIKVV